MLSLGVTFILMKPTGEMLLQQRDDGRGKKIRYQNMWCFPGGECNHGEEPINAVIREIFEEYRLNVTKDHCYLIRTYEHDEMLDMVFICMIPENSTPICMEGQSLAWKPMNEIKNFQLAWNQKVFLPDIDKYILHSGHQ